METSRIRIVFTHSSPDAPTGLYGLELLDTTTDSSFSTVPFEVTCDKFVTPDDQLVMQLRIRNKSATVQSLEIVPVVDWEGQYEGRVLTNRPKESTTEPCSPWVVEAEARNRLHGYDLVTRLRYGVSSDPPRPLDVTESRRFTIAIARGPKDNGDFFRKAFGFRYILAPDETWIFKAAVELKRPDEPSSLDRVLAVPSSFTRTLEAKSTKLGTISVERQDARDLLPDQIAKTEAWYASNVAIFNCSDPLLEKMFLHRAYLLKKNILSPSLGALIFSTQSQGRWHNSRLAQVLSDSAGHQVREARWLADPRFWSGHLQTFTNNQRPDHVYSKSVNLAGPGPGDSANWITSTSWDGHLVHPDLKLLRSVVEALASNIRGVQATFDKDGYGLLSLENHEASGMEFQPAFFAFSEFKTGPDHKQPLSPLSIDRVDFMSYQYGGAQAVARIYRALQQPNEAKEFETLATKIREAVTKFMWNSEDGFFYSLNAENKAQAQVKEATALAPFYFRMFKPTDVYSKAWVSVLDTEQFWTPWPVATVSRKSPAYSQTGWPADENLATAPLMANGPTWPRTNSLVLSAMAETLRAARQADSKSALEKIAPLTCEKLWELFVSYSRVQFRNQDLTFPWTGQAYNGETGAWKTQERDINDSTWLDILIPELLGLVPREDEILEIDPLIPPEALSYFTLDGQRYHSHDISLVWDKPGDTSDSHADGREGFDIYLDGKLVSSSPELKRVLIDMKTGQPVEPKVPKPVRSAVESLPKP